MSTGLNKERDEPSGNLVPACGPFDFLDFLPTRVALGGCHLGFSFFFCESQTSANKNFDISPHRGRPEYLLILGLLVSRGTTRPTHARQAHAASSCFALREKGERVNYRVSERFAAVRLLTRIH